MKYNIATFGCQMNEYDSDLIAKILDDAGWESTPRQEDADVLLFNTCAIREKAENTAMARISKIKPLKVANPDLKIIVCGCMAQHLEESLMKKVHIIDYILGPDQYRRIPELVKRPTKKVNKDNRPYRIFTTLDKEENYYGMDARLKMPWSTYITIQRGCNKRCSYCIVPYVRGPEKNRDIDDILREIHTAVDQGVTEITLLGQTVNAYKTENDTFASLLTKVSEIDGIRRIRFTSPHPKHYTDELIDVLLHNPKMCKYVHLPIQSGSNAILKKMHRQYTLEKYAEIVEKLRSEDPLYAISTDIICGFVGETEADFEETLKAVERFRFDFAYMFIFSPRSGTEAAKEPEILTYEQKLERHSRLVSIQNEITLERNRMMLGRTETLLVEHISSKNPNEWLGKTDSFKKVIFKPNQDIHPGAYVRCKINDIHGWTLRGTLQE